MLKSGTRLSAVVTLLLAGLVCWTGCNKKSDPVAAADKSAPGKSKPLLCVSVLTLGNPFFKEMGDAFQAEGAKRGYDVQVTAGEDSAKQADQVKDFLVRKAAAIVLTPCDSKSVGTAIAEANKAGVPVFTADVASTADGVKVVSHCATDNLEGGRVAGRAVVEALHGQGKVAVINHPEVESGQLREKGFLQEIAKAPGITVVVTLAAGGQRTKADEVTQDILQRNGDINAIFGINDQMALGALAAVEKAGKLSQIKIIGFDGATDARQAIKAGKMYATVMQYPKKIAATTVDSIDNHMSGTKVKPVILIPPTIYLKADADADGELK